MKGILKLTILVASLLLVTNVVFAQTPAPVCQGELFCYNITATDENSNTNNDNWVVCLVSDIGVGWLYSYNADAYYDLYLFGGGPGWFNTSGGPGFANGDPNYTTWIAHGPNESGFLQPIGEGSSKGALLTGEGVHIGGSTRYTIQGKKVPCKIAAPD